MPEPIYFTQHTDNLTHNHDFRAHSTTHHDAGLDGFESHMWAKELSCQLQSQTETKIPKDYIIVPHHIPRPGLAYPNKSHRTLGDVPSGYSLPSPESVYTVLANADGWPYENKKGRRRLLERDRAFVATLYTTGLRVTEARRLKVAQLVETPDGKGWMFEQVELVKVKTTRTRYREVRRGVFRRMKEKKQRKNTHRVHVYLPNRGPRVKFTQLVLKWYQRQKAGGAEYLFSQADLDAPISRVTAWKVVLWLTGNTPHFFRLLAENYMYAATGYDMVSTAKYFGVERRTLDHYLRGREEELPRV